ncbi:MAG: HAD-IA family hydrolase [Nitrospinaceae bacterium]|nr:HAD-IA family hydrolase [Nitrospinaceae bacterium]NIR57333.1 HAD-IA family hydrolase [Nitrospinaceae bacterium]NIS87785.1 HAD-IA family hydrolase [Nitrospinaceae bacterium]NIT84655.1 HAD-IA family hydrolase [Nitrospinaceae bacterium]NIU46834.1 HAD-IA family hydrolase [Nitrospinaceae bacterium]
MTPIQLFVFDFDGTLADTRLDIADSVNRVLREMGLPERDRETLFGFIGRGVQHLMTRSLEGTGCDDLPRAIDAFMQHYEAHLMDQTTLFPNCREALTHLAGKEKAILSNKPTRFITRILDALDCRAPFASIIGGDIMPEKKPDPGGLHHLMEKHRKRPDEILMIGDSLVDIETGKRAGVRTCGVTYGHARRAELEEARPDWIIDDLAELKLNFH